MKNYMMLLLLLVGVFSFSGCSKYEEGSNFTILTKKMRLTNTWKLTSNMVNGIETFDGSYTYILNMEKDGSGYIEISNSLGTERTEGTWELSSDKEDLILKDDEGNTTTYEIIQLKANDLKLSQETTFMGYPVAMISKFTGN